MENIKLTETQVKLLKPLQDAYNRANTNLSNALFLVAGKHFDKYEIKGDELIILDEEIGSQLK
jgi:hypothetical protein